MSAEQASSLTTGSHSEQPHPLMPASVAAPTSFAGAKGGGAGGARSGGAGGARVAAHELQTAKTPRFAAKNRAKGICITPYTPKLDSRLRRAHDARMPDDEKPNPVDDLKKGLGLLFRAAKTAVDKLPTGKLEDVVMSGAREVSRAVENVAETIDKGFFHKEGRPPTPPANAGADRGAGDSAGDRADVTAAAPDQPVDKSRAPDATHPDSPAAGNDEVRGPRVG